MSSDPPLQCLGLSCTRRQHRRSLPRKTKMEPLSPNNEVEHPQLYKPLTKAVEAIQRDPKTQKLLDPKTTEFEDDEFWPLSGKPYFHVFVVKSHLKPLYQLVFPKKMYSLLPCSRVPVVLTYCGKKWEMVYYGDSNPKRFDRNWKKFAIDTDLKLGDACVFEIVEFSSSNLKFRVQILRGEFPSQLMERVKDGAFVTKQ
ncbi:B3 domain-containing protein Os06g0112300-like isoform X3 [Actinidia eriantha]|uniref:B3 domain-containing protein Os06g0112300-like isoform X3 n=1 Tax=Actinidia eriantha TaxID=165200 RepID=UPI00258D0937|nr:B3 domain-containing protein Os06g0112300-like isoform X3 [Actinidia eriantha]